MSIVIQILHKNSAYLKIGCVVFVVKIDVIRYYKSKLEILIIFTSRRLYN